LQLDEVDEMMELLNEMYVEEVEQSAIKIRTALFRAFPHFRHLESATENYGMDEASFHLQKAKMVMITVHAPKSVLESFCGPQGVGVVQHRCNLFR